MQNRKSPYKIRITNVVSTASYGELDLNAINYAIPQTFTHSEFNPSCIFYKNERARVSFLIYKSGKVICLGAKSSAHTERAFEELTKELKDKGLYKGKKPEIKIQNIVAYLSSSYLIDLETAVYKLYSPEGRVLYEPEQFPGLIYEMKDPKATFLLFRTGKIICLGTKKEEDTYNALNKLYRMLEDKNLFVE